METTKVDPPFKYFNYAVLKSRGIFGLFEFMRYECCFFARGSDVEQLIQLYEDVSYDDMVNKTYSFLLGLYDYRPARRPGWTELKLLASHEFKRINTSDELIVYNSDSLQMRLDSPMKFRCVKRVDATVPVVLQTMYDNKAFPFSAIDASYIESAFQEASDRLPISVHLGNHQSKRLDWK